MESMDDRVSQFCREWEYYCYPDKEAKCRPQADALLRELDQQQEATSTAVTSQATPAKRTRPGYFSCGGRCWTWCPTRRRLPRRP